MSQSVRSGAFLVMAAGVLWGTTGTSQALSPLAGSPVGLGTARLAGAGLILGLVAIVTVRGRLGRLVRDHLGWFAVGAAAMAGYQLSFFTATRETGVAVGTLTAIGSAPLVAGAIAAATGHRPSRRWLLATGIAIAGLVLLVAPGDGGSLDAAGVAAGLAAGASYALYTWASRHLIDRGVAGVPLLAGLFVGGALLSLPFAWRQTGEWLAEPGGLLVVAYLTVVATVVPYLVWIRGMATTPPAVATTLTLTEPLTAATLGVLVLHEPVTGALLGGAALLVVGLALTASANTGDGPAAPTPARDPEAVA
ncbi:DMT family transporter [Spirilliplanes yamanashiensis]|uniref:Transporter n=1 Tax=Spirilliplanes yamanashiensis TaxID=42233 RepID=A0A8J3YEB3_9ACTN|nr:EamA family transporter [Spirilliplanes yamanashiensis]MDP9818531.1 DME family drug/metabolite transporter [Spirilliplanes yamanashiensis]GIJ06339.1 transporter [Spirilliplanes yamanashiensis]